MRLIEYDLETAAHVVQIALTRISAEVATINIYRWGIGAT
jgi:hypothetical protein